MSNVIPITGQLTTEPQPQGRLILKRAVKQKLGNIDSTTLWRWTKDRPGFPQPYRLSATLTAWSEAELDAWIASLPRGNHAPPLGALAAAARSGRRGRPRKVVPFYGPTRGPIGFVRRAP